VSEGRPPLHHLVRGADAGTGEILGEATGAIHLALSIRSPAAGGVGAHVHPYEETFHVLAGNPVLSREGSAVRLRPGASGVVPVGVAHAWRAEDEARWVEIAVPPPRSGSPWRAAYAAAEPGERDALDLDVRDPRHAALTLLNERHTATLVPAPGAVMKMLVDAGVGAALSTMFIVEYEPGASIAPHDHAFEEAYLILAGEVEADADGSSYTLGPGDVFWTGVGSVHGFANRTPSQVRWLEIQAPQPPARYAFRFAQPWIEQPATS
jgi:quercetin dioxygenase-like cupin family protein